MRKAVLNDVQDIFNIVEASASKGLMLHRALTDICDSLRDFFVYEEDGAVRRMRHAHNSEDMGEIRSLAVRKARPAEASEATRQGVPDRGALHML